MWWRLAFAFALAIGAALPAVAAAAPEEIEALRKRLAAEEIATMTLLRSIPAELEMAAEEKFVSDVAEQAKVEAKMTQLPGAERVLLDGGRPSPIRLHRVEVAGRGSLDAIAWFLRFLAKGPRLRIVESLRVDGKDGNEGAYVARVALPLCQPEDPEPPTARGTNAYVVELRQRVEDAAALRELLMRMEEQATRGNGSVAADLLEESASRRELRVTTLRVGDSMVLEGAIVGARARADFLAALNARGLWAERVRTPAAGACRPFAMTLVRETREGTVEKVDAASLSRESAALCATEPRLSLGRVAARGSASGPGAITARMRGIDVRHFVRVLGDLTEEDFVVDPALRGSVDVEIEGATLDETIAALGKAGVNVGTGPMRHVSSSAPRPLGKKGVSDGGEPLTFLFDDANLAGLLCNLGSILELDMNVVPGLAARTSVHATEQPRDRILAAMILGAGLDVAIDGNSFFVGPAESVKLGSRGKWVKACAVESPSSFSDVRPRAEELDPADLTLAGVAKGREGWTAYAYGPWRQLVSLGKDQEIFRGKVTAVGPDGMTVVAARAGTVEFRLAR